MSNELDKLDKEELQEDIHEAVKERKQVWQEMKRRARKQFKRENRDR